MHSNYESDSDQLSHNEKTIRLNPQPLERNTESLTDDENDDEEVHSSCSSDISSTDKHRGLPIPL